MSVYRIYTLHKVLKPEKLHSHRQSLAPNSTRMSEQAVLCVRDDLHPVPEHSICNVYLIDS